MAQPLPSYYPVQWDPCFSLIPKFIDWDLSREILCLIVSWREKNIESKEQEFFTKALSLCQFSTRNQSRGTLNFSSRIVRLAATKASTGLLPWIMHHCPDTSMMLELLDVNIISMKLKYGYDDISNINILSQTPTHRSPLQRGRPLKITSGQWAAHRHTPSSSSWLYLFGFIFSNMLMWTPVSAKAN